MPTIPLDTVRHIADLARLSLTDAEAEKFTRQLSDIIGYVAQLQAVDTTGVEPTEFTRNEENATRSDAVDAFPDEGRVRLLNAVPQRENDGVVVPEVFQEP